MRLHAITLVLVALALSGCKEKCGHEREKGRYCDRMKDHIRMMKDVEREHLFGARSFMLTGVEYCAREVPDDLDAIDMLLLGKDPDKIDAELTRLEQSIEYFPPR